MSTLDFIIGVFCRVDDHLKQVPRPCRSGLSPSEIVTVAILYTVKGISQRRFYGWLCANFADLFPGLPDRTRLFRQIRKHIGWMDALLAEPTLLGIADSFGIELIHPRREGRSKKQEGKKGVSNHRWIVGIKFCPVLNGRGQIVAWDFGTANLHDGDFQETLATVDMGVLTDTGFHRSERRGGDSGNLLLCSRGQANVRMIVETIFSLLSRLWNLKHITERAWKGIEARLASTVATYNLLWQWSNEGNQTGYAKINLAQFVL